MLQRYGSRRSAATTTSARSAVSSSLGERAKVRIVGGASTGRSGAVAKQLSVQLSPNPRGFGMRQPPGWPAPARGLMESGGGPSVGHRGGRQAEIRHRGQRPLAGRALGQLLREMQPQAEELLEGTRNYRRMRSGRRAGWPDVVPHRSLAQAEPERAGLYE